MSESERHGTIGSANGSEGIEIILNKLYRDSIVVKMIGIIDSLNYEYCRTYCEREVNTEVDKGLVNVIVDLTGIENVASLVFEPCKTIGRAVHSKKGNIVLVISNPKLLEMFRLLIDKDYYIVSDSLDNGIAVLEDKKRDRPQ